MRRSELAKIRKIVSDIKGYADLYEDLYKTRIDSRERLEIVRLKMEYCKEQIMKLSLDLKSFLPEIDVSQDAAGSLSAIGRQMLQIMNEISNYESQKDELLTRLERLFSEYQSGKYSYFDYMRQMESIMNGKQKEELLTSHEGRISRLTSVISSLNSKMFYRCSSIALEQNLRLNGPAVEIIEVPEIVEEKIEIAKPIEEIPVIREEAPIEMPEIEIPEKPALPVPENFETVTEELETPAPPEPVAPRADLPSEGAAKEQKQIYETPEEDEQVEELLSKLKSGEIKPTENVMKWLIEKLKKQRPKPERTEEEMRLDQSMLEGGGEDKYETHQF